MKIHPISSSLAAFFAMFLAGVAVAMPSSLANISDEKIEEFRLAGKINGIQLAIVTQKKMVVKKFGHPRDGHTWSGQDLLRIASVSKSFIAALYFKIAETGELRGWQTLDMFFSPDLLPKIDLKKIKITDLLRHSSGIPDYFTQDFIQKILEKPGQVKTESSALAAVKSLDPLFEPGTSINYSNTNYVLLGLILDSVAKKRGVSGGHESLLRKLILDPLQLQETFYEHKESQLYNSSNIISGYFNGNDFLGIQQGYGLANGGLLSSVRDVAVFFEALFDPTSAIAVGEKMAPSAAENFGFGLYRMSPNKEFIGHTGEFAGYLSFAAHNPKSGVTIVGFANDSSEAAKVHFGKIQEHLLNSY